MLQTLKKYVLISAAVVLSGMSNAAVPVASAYAISDSATSDATEVVEDKDKNIGIEEAQKTIPKDKDKDEENKKPADEITPPNNETVTTPVENTTENVPNDASDDKVYVCKYVGTPGINERLKDGKNPIRVSANATGGAQVGEYFADAQGRSFVVAVYVKGEPAPTTADCPTVKNDEEVRAEKPMKNDVCGTKNDTFTVANTKGVKYFVNEKKVTGENSTDDELMVEVTAKAKNGYVLKGKTEFTLNFTDKDCVTIKKKATGFVDANQNGVVDFGDEVQWKIVVRNISSKESFTIELSDNMATIKGSGKTTLSPGEKHVFKATSVLLADQIEACEATNTANFKAYHVSPKWEYTDEIELHDVFNLNQTSLTEWDGNGKNESFNGSASATATFDCPAPGQGSAGDPDDTDDDKKTIVTSIGTSGLDSTGSATVLPSELPQTGANDTSIVVLVGALLTLLTYLTAYFAQAKRPQETV